MHIASTPSFSKASPIICEPVEHTLPPTAQYNPEQFTQAQLTQLQFDPSQRASTFATEAHSENEFSLAADFSEALEFAAQRRQKSLQWLDLNEISSQATNRSTSPFVLMFGNRSGRNSSQANDDQIKIEYGRLLCEIVNLSLVWLAGTAINLGCGIISTFILLSFIALKLIQSGVEPGEKTS